MDTPEKMDTPEEKLKQQTAHRTKVSAVEKCQAAPLRYAAGTRELELREILATDRGTGINEIPFSRFLLNIQQAEHCSQSQ
jgi:hypothetical protein